MLLEHLTDTASINKATRNVFAYGLLLGLTFGILAMGVYNINVKPVLSRSAELQAQLERY